LAAYLGGTPASPRFSEQIVARAGGMPVAQEDGAGNNTVTNGTQQQFHDVHSTSPMERRT
jgi:hypothetical protein